MARAYAERGWRDRAVARYRRAFEADPSARGAPPMRDDLLLWAQEPSTQDRAAHALLAIYGAELLPALDAQLAALPAGSEAATRLRRLRGVIACAQPRR